MKILKGKVKIGDYRGSKIFVDWTYLTKDRGFKKEEEIFQQLLGRLFYYVSFAAFVGLLVAELSLGNFIVQDMLFPNNFIGGVGWLIVVFFVYSFYLRRDREKFYDTLDLTALTAYRQKLENHTPVESVEILDFVDHDVLNILDDLIVDKDPQIYTKAMLALIKLPEVKKLLDRLGLEPKSLSEKVKNFQVEVKGDKSFQINKMLYESFVLGEKFGFSYIGEWVLFLKLALEEYQLLFRELNIQKETLLAVLVWTKSQAIKNRYKKLWKYRASLKPQSTVNRSYTSAYTATLNKFSNDLTLNAVKGDFVYSLSREEEVEEVVRNLRQEKAAVLLIGEPGVGKSTILKSIAVRMVVEDMPKELQDKRLVAFDFQRAIAHAKGTNELRKTLEKIFDEVAKAKNVILVIDDIDELVNIREEIAGEIISTISESLEQNKLKLIATTSRAGYSRSIKPNSTLSNMFDNVEIDEPSPEIALQILFDERIKLERKYGIKIQFDALRAAVDLTVRYDTTRLLPFKAIDALEDACVYSLEEGLTHVTANELEKVVSRDAGVKVGSLSQDEGQKLMQLESLMHKRVIGQDKAVQATAQALRRARAGLAGKSRPIASFLFFGPTGVGKTEVARTLAAVYFGDEKLVTRIDMSEFQEGENVKRLIGYMQGDDFIGGQLTEKVRSNPFSLVLLDEIEKANPKVLDLFLQVLDEGHITDGIGRKVDFKNTIIIATSNIGSRKIAENLAQGNDYQQTFRIASEELKKNLRIEFINRFDKVIMFKPLSKVEIEKIAELMMRKLVAKLSEQGIDLKYSGQLLSELAEKGYSPVFGARELNRLIQDGVESKIADLIVSGKLKSGESVVVNSLNSFVIK